MKPLDLFLGTIIALFSFTFTNVNGIKCFQCNSFDEGCSSLTTNDISSKYFHDCDNKHAVPFCRKTIQTILESNNLVRITRSCGWKSPNANTTRCYTYDTQFKLDITCQCYADGCNSGPSLSEKVNFLKYLMSIMSSIVLTRVF